MNGYLSPGQRSPAVPHSPQSPLPKRRRRAGQPRRLLRQRRPGRHHVSRVRRSVRRRLIGTVRHDPDGLVGQHAARCPDQAGRRAVPDQALRRHGEAGADHVHGLLGHAGHPGRRQRRSRQLSPEGQAVATFLDELKPYLGDPQPIPPKGASTILSTLLTRIQEDVLFGRSDPAAAAKRFIAEATAGIS